MSSRSSGNNEGGGLTLGVGVVGGVSVGVLHVDVMLHERHLQHLHAALGEVHEPVEIPTEGVDASKRQLSDVHW